MPADVLLAPFVPGFIAEGRYSWRLNRMRDVPRRAAAGGNDEILRADKVIGAYELQEFETTWPRS